MKFAVAFALVWSLLVSNGAARADSLSADAVFGSATKDPETSVEPQSAEDRLAKTRKLVQERAQDTTGHAATPAWKSEPDSGGLAGTGFKMFQGLALCVGLLLIGMHFFKKLDARNRVRSPGRRMRIIERISVAAKTTLVLAEVDGKKILMAVGNDKVSFHPSPAQEENGLQLDSNLELICQDDVKAA
jgi:flagellar biogenesis protein FliO